MKTFILFTLITSTASAFTIEKYQSTPDGVERQDFEFSGSEITYNRGTNLFDTDQKDLRIGTLVPVDAKVLEEDKKAIEAVLTKVNAADEFLKKEEGTSFNEVAGAPGHRTVIILDSKVIPPESKYFAELDRHFSNLKAAKWKQVSGYELSPDLKSVTEFVKGTPTKKDYVKVNYCNRSTRSCSYFGGGKLFFKNDVY